MTLTEFLEKFPGLFGFMSFVFGGAISLAVGWKITREMIRDQRERINEVTDERDGLRTDLRKKREDHKQAQLKIVDLEARPNLGSLQNMLEGQSTLMKGIGGSMESLGNALQQHVADDARTFKGIQTALESIPRAMAAQVSAFNKRQQQLIRALKPNKQK